MYGKRMIAAGLTPGMVLGVAQQRRRRRPEPARLPPPIAADFRPMRLASRFAPIVNPPSIKAAEVADQAGDSELVLGVVIGGAAGGLLVVPS